MPVKHTPPPKAAKEFAAASASTTDVEATASPRPARLIDRHEVMRRVPYTYPWIWQKMREGKFPRSVNVGGKITWLEEDIEKWIRSRPVQVLKGDAPDSEVQS
jgi:prophage regulatory protein